METPPLEEKYMTLTEQEKHEVYVTISIQLAEMFDTVQHIYAKPGETEKVKLISDVEAGICEGWKDFQRSPASASEWVTD